MTAQEVIKSFMASLDNTTLSGESALDEAVQACSNFTSVQEVINQMVADCNSSDSANSFLQQYCGIILSNEDTGSITGKDAGTDTVKTAESIVPENGDLKTYTSDSFTVNGVTFKLDTSYSNLTSAEKYIWNGLYTWWAKNSLDLISDSYGENFSFTSDSSATVSTIKIKFEDIGTTGVAVTENSATEGETKSITLTINLNYYADIDTTDKNGSSSTEGAFYLDRTLAHELTHAVMMANIKYYDKLPQFIKEGIAELTHGIDDTRKARIRYLAGNSLYLSQYLDLSDTSTGSNNAYAAGYIFMRYLAKQSADPVAAFTDKADYFINYINNTVLSALGGVDTVYNFGENVIVNGNAGNDYLISQATSAAPTIFGGYGNDTVMSFVEKSSLNGGAGNDYLYSGYGYINGTVASGSSGNLNTLKPGTGNDTIYLADGSANNLIQYASGDGNDYIVGFDSDDTLSITGDDFSTVQSNSDIIVSIGDGKITLRSAANESLNIISKSSDDSFVTVTGVFTDYDDIYSNSNSKVVMSALGGNDTILNSADSVIAYGNTGNDFIKSTGNKVTLSGGYDNDTLIGGNGADILIGNNGNDYISGKKGNDCIIGGNGSDTIYGGNGKDTIYGGNGNDYLIGGYGNDTMYGNYGSDTISGGDGSDYLNGGYDNDSISGGYGKDTLWGNFGNDTLTGGNGSDLFIYTAGNDIITDYTESDKISVSGSYSSSVSNDDIIIRTSKGTLTIIDAANKTISTL